MSLCVSVCVCVYLYQDRAAQLSASSSVRSCDDPLQSVSH